MNAVKIEQTTLEKILVDDYLTTWLQAFIVDREAANLADASIAFYKQRLHLFEQYADSQAITKISQITSDGIRQFMIWLESTGHNPGGQHGCFRVLKVFLRWYWIETEQTQRNPIERVRAPRVELAPITGIESSEFQKLLSACRGRGFYDLRDSAIICALFDSGCRATEALEIRLEDFNHTTGQILIRKSKSKKPRVVFLGQTSRRVVRKYLMARKDFSEWLFVTHAGEKLTRWGLRLLLERRAKQAGIPPQSAHDFRRGWALTMLKNGMDVFSLQRLGGWSDLGIMKRYLAQTSGDLQASFAKGSPVDRAD